MDGGIGGWIDKRDGQTRTYGLTGGRASAPVRGQTDSLTNAHTRAHACTGRDSWLLESW